MAIVPQQLVELPLAALHEQLSAPIEADDEARLDAVLAAVAEAVEQAIQTDVAQIALQRDRLDRVARRLTGDAEHALSQRALGYLRRFDVDLDRARTRLLGELADERRAEEAVVLRSRVFAALDRPRRPRELAEELGVDPSQVSRELRRLVSDGRVERSDPPAGDPGDGRAHWYERRRGVRVQFI